MLLSCPWTDFATPINHLEQIEQLQMPTIPENLGRTSTSGLAAEAIAHLQACFPQATQQLHTYSAPGRVNLIGEHIDYNGGMVFPCAINHSVTVAIRLADKENNNRLRLCSKNFIGEFEIDLNQPIEKHGDSWVNYPLAVIDQLQKLNKPIYGFDVCFFGDLPGGSGLSSSAAIEIVVAYALNELFDLNISRLGLAKICQRAENEFIGVACGIMDQFAVAMARENSAIQLDCNTLEYEHVAVELIQSVFIIANTNQQRGLAEGGYNERVQECYRALDIVREHSSATISTLAQIKPEELNALRTFFSNDTVAFDRARHVSSEQQRVFAATSALKKGDLAQFGQLMTASHHSLRDLYNVSSQPLDAMVEAALKAPGTMGSRLTGAGFGGCTISLVETLNLDAWLEQVRAGYEKATDLVPDFYAFQPAAGVNAIGVIDG